MEECMVARNAICIIKRALSRAKGVQQHELDLQNTGTAPNSENGIRQSGSNGMAIASPLNFNTMLPETEVENSLGGDFEDCFTWLDSNPNPFDDYQQALFWTTWGQEVDLLGT